LRSDVGAYTASHVADGCRWLPLEPIVFERLVLHNSFELEDKKGVALITISHAFDSPHHMQLALGQDGVEVAPKWTQGQTPQTKLILPPSCWVVTPPVCHVGFQNLAASDKHDDYFDKRNCCHGCHLKQDPAR
jgi:hypothetical protein